MFKVDDGETARCFCSDGEELWVDTRVVVLKHVATDRDAFIAILLLVCLSIDVAELAMMHHFLKNHCNILE